MSQCDDTSDPLLASGSGDLKSNEASGGQCHDSYECIGSPGVTANVTLSIVIGTGFALFA
jgi:hypothetical protein